MDWKVAVPVAAATLLVATARVVAANIDDDEFEDDEYDYEGEYDDEYEYYDEEDDDEHEERSGGLLTGFFTATKSALSFVTSSERTRLRLRLTRGRISNVRDAIGNAWRAKLPAHREYLPEDEVRLFLSSSPWLGCLSHKHPAHTTTFPRAVDCLHFSQYSSYRGLLVQPLHVCPGRIAGRAAGLTRFDRARLLLTDVALATSFLDVRPGIGPVFGSHGP